MKRLLFVLLAISFSFVLSAQASGVQYIPTTPSTSQGGGYSASPSPSPGVRYIPTTPGVSTPKITSTDYIVTAYSIQNGGLYKKKLKVRKTNDGTYPMVVAMYDSDVLGGRWVTVSGRVEKCRHGFMSSDSLEESFYFKSTIIPSYVTWFFDMDADL